MYIRRLRTLMDQILQPPGTPAAEFRLENRVDELGARLAPEAALDYALWGLKSDGVSWIDPGPYPNGLARIKLSFAARRDYLYTTISGLIPAAQVGNPQIDFGAIEFNPASANQDQEYIELVNNNSFAVDISAWQLTGGVTHTFAPGTVIPAGSTLYVSPDVAAFRSRTTGPSSGQQLFVQGDYAGHLSNFGETLNLLAADATQIDTITYVGDPSLAQQFLRITEVNYNPYAAMIALGELNVAADEFEFIELMNTSSTDTLDLTGVKFASGLTFDFTASSVTSLAPGDRVLVVKNLSAFESRYGTGLNIAGTFTLGSLSNNGEELKLDDVTNSTIVQFTYNDAGRWPGRADGKGATLEVIDPNGDMDSAENWRSSNEFLGTPAAAGTGPVFDVIVNEVLSHSDGAALDKVELYNTTASTIDLEGWHLTDTHNNFSLFTFAAGTTITPGGYLVLDESQLGFALDGQLGDDIWLMEGDPTDANRPVRFADHHDLDATETDVSLGRVPNGDPTAQGASLFPMNSQTLGSGNGGFVRGDVIFSEVYYHPPAQVPTNPDIADGELEFVELANRSAATVDISGWQLRQSGGVPFSIPPGTQIAPSQTTVLVRFDPTLEPTKAAAFRTIHGIGSGVALVGSAAPIELGSLNNAGDTVELLRPEEPANPLTGFLLVDRVAYDDAPPWPIDADGLGMSLSRTVATNFGNFAASWIGATPSPGVTMFVPLPAGDMSGNGLVNLGDVNLIIMALVDPTTFAALYSHVNAQQQGDVDSSGSFDTGDLSAFVELFGPATASSTATSSASFALSLTSRVSASVSPQSQVVTTPLSESSTHLLTAHIFSGAVASAKSANESALVDLWLVHDSEEVAAADDAWDLALLALLADEL